MNKPAPLVFWLLAAGVTSASAMSLGPSPDSAWVGRALDLRFPLQGEARETGGSLCLSAEVRYGDDRISESSVAAEDAAGDARNIRVRTTVPVNEPIVSVRVQAGCESPLSRTYTFLAGAPVQTASAALLPSTAGAPRAAISPSPLPPLPRSASTDGAGSRSGPAPARRAAAANPERAAASGPTADAPVRPRPPAIARRVEPTVASGPRTAQGAVASQAAPAKPAAQPILKLEDPSWYGNAPESLRRSDALASRPAASDEERKRAAAEWERLGGSPATGGATAVPAATAAGGAGLDDQVAQIRAELAAARKEIARLQNEVSARATPAPEETDYRAYLLAALGAVVVGASGAWLLGRRKQRKAEAGAWWHGDPSMQSPAAAASAFGAAGAVAQSEMSSVSGHDLAYPVSMLPEDLERSSMFPDFARHDAPATVPPYDEAGETLPYDDSPAPPAPVAAPDPRGTPLPHASAATPAAFEFDLPAAAAPVAAAAPLASLPQAAAPASAGAAPWKDRYLDLDLDLDAPGDPEPAQDGTAQVAAPGPAPVDGGNMIDFESTGLGSYVKPSSREPRG
ncbi:MAG: hypothetical protein PGN26_04495 [Xylophilus ampelinus]